MINSKKVAGYIRVSSEEQTKGFSLESQRKKIEEYVQFKGWQVNKFYMDEGISGTSIKKRKSFQEMIKEAKEGKFSAIIVTKFDRAFRNVIDALNTIDEMGKLKIDFVSVTEDIDTTNPMGRALFSIISIFAELESKRNSERVRDTRINQFNKGVPVGRSFYGYRPIYKDKVHKRGVIKIIPYPKEAEIVQDCFKMASEGVKYSDVCKKHKLKPQQYYNIIKNKVYCGYIEFEGQIKKGIHEPIISEELFNKVNK